MAFLQWASGDAVGAVINRPGDSAPAGAVSTGDAPPIASSQSPLSSVSACGENCARSLAPPLPTARGAAGAPFRSCPKRECAAPGGREKGAKRAPVQWPSARDGSRRIGACSDFAWPSGTLSPSAIPATTVPWRMVRRASGCKDAFDQLLFPRVPLRYALPGQLWRLVLSGGRPCPLSSSQVGSARKAGRTPLRRSGPRPPEKGSRIRISPGRKSRFHTRPCTPETS